MVGYKLSKNDWVTPFFVIFRSVREKLLVTVFPEHPVALEKLKSCKQKTKYDMISSQDAYPHGGLSAGEISANPVI